MRTPRTTDINSDDKHCPSCTCEPVLTGASVRVGSSYVDGSCGFCSRSGGEDAPVIVINGVTGGSGLTVRFCMLCMTQVVHTLNALSLVPSPSPVRGKSRR